MSAALGAIQASPVVVAESIERIQPLVDAAVKATGVDAVLAEIRAPFEVQIALSTKFDVSGDTNCQVEPV